MNRKNPLLLLSLFLFGVFAFISFLVYLNLFSSVDLMSTQFLQKTISRNFDTLFSLFSLFGSLEIVTLIILLLWVLYRKLNLFYILLSFGLFHVFELLGKFFLNHPNPPSEFARYDLPFYFPSSGVNTGSSFPSGHMGRTIFISIILGLIVSRNKKISEKQKYLIYVFIFLFDFIMFISRIYLGEHWLSDILGATVLGASFAILSLAFL